MSIKPPVVFQFFIYVDNYGRVIIFMAATDVKSKINKRKSYVTFNHYTVTAQCSIAQLSPQ